MQDRRRRWLPPASRPSRAWLAVVLPLGLLAWGCGRTDDLPRERVSGTITLDGVALDSGTITFMPSAKAGAGTAAATAIKGGSYAIPAGEGPVPGSYLVSIASPTSEPDPAGAAAKPAAKAGRAKASSEAGATGEPAEGPIRDRVPPRYNDKSTLTADVTKGGKNTFDFALKSR